VVLEKDGEDQLDRLCEKLGSTTKRQGGEEYTANNKRKAKWIGHILCRNCTVKHVIEEKIEGRIAPTGGRGRGRKKMLHDLKEKAGKRKY